MTIVRPALAIMILLLLSGCSKDHRAAPRAIPPGARAAAVAVESVTYNGWPNSWRVRNASCELVVVPAVSRVMRFALTGGQNVLWENPELAGKTFPADDGTWHNIGGEKLWPTQQKDYFKKYTGHDGWPPPWPWDAGACRAEPIANGVRLILPHDARFGAHIVREFTLDDAKPLVHVHQYIEKTEGPSTYMTVWTVCQANNPVSAFLPCTDGKFFHFDETSPQMQAKPGYVALGRDEKRGLKIGVRPDGQNGWVAAVFNDASAERQVMLVQSHQVVTGAGAAPYPDDGLQAELYTSPKNFANYTEMELLGPLTPVPAGKRLEDDAVWQLIPIAGNADHVGIATAAHREALDRLR